MRFRMTVTSPTTSAFLPNVPGKGKPRKLEGPQAQGITLDLSQVSRSRRGEEADFRKTQRASSAFSRRRLLFQQAALWCERTIGADAEEVVRWIWIGKTDGVP